MVEELRKARERFWALSWWWKGGTFAVTGFILLAIIASATGGGDEASDDGTTTPTPTVLASETEPPSATGSPTASATATASTTASPTPSASPTAEPTQPPTAAPTQPPTAAPTPTAQLPAGCVDINTASFEDLQQIIHIGPDRAQEIINKRPFSSVDGLNAVTGIGPSRLADIKQEGLACAS